jgi:hypothetical protein
VTKYIQPERLFSMSSRQCEAISISGLAVEDVKHWLRLVPVYRDVRRLVLHVGVNTCFATNDVITAAEWLELFTLLKKVFPLAQLQLSTILPPLNPDTALAKTVDDSNSHLAEMCRRTGATLINHYPTFRTTRGRAKKACYADNVHPSKMGTINIVTNIKASVRQDNSHGSGSSYNRDGVTLSRPSGQDGDTKHASPSHKPVEGGNPSTVSGDTRQPARTYQHLDPHTSQRYWSSTCHPDQEQRSNATHNAQQSQVERGRDESAPLQHPGPVNQQQYFNPSSIHPAHLAPLIAMWRQQQFGMWLQAQAMRAPHPFPHPFPHPSAVQSPYMTSVPS